MKKKLLYIVAIIAVIACLCGCGASYSEAVNNEAQGNFAGGYFTVITKWDDEKANYKIVYANDTKVKYLVMTSGYKCGITPLYNEDVSLQVYKESGE